MAIRKLPSGRFQARVTGTDGRVLSQVFDSRLEAQEQALKWRKAKHEGQLVVNTVRHMTLNIYFEQWYAVVGQVSTESDSGWRKTQLSLYRNYIAPIIGTLKLVKIRPIHIQSVLLEMTKNGKSEQTRVHVFNLLRKMFGDAIENYEYLTFNPVLKKFKPRLPQKEAKHLNLEQLIALLQHVDGKQYGLAIWIQLYMGLRAGELLGLRWDDVDLTEGRIFIRRCYVRRLNIFRDYPKGGKQHTRTIPGELLERLERTTKGTDLVVTSPHGSILPYNRYLKKLKEYCTQIKIPVIGTHGLRHSTSELYMKHGATRDDLQRLFAHSSPDVTARYLHGRTSNLESVAKVIRILDRRPNETSRHKRQS